VTRERAHTHACQSCGAVTECYGELEPNHDGFPVVICRAFHLDGGQVDSDFRCDDCDEKLRAENYDPPDPDGEDFRGGEAAGYLWEQMEAARKLK
jgi:hypothetical protein